MTVQTAYDLAAVWYRDRMAHGWDPPTALQAEGVFRRFQLLGDFWILE